MASQDQGFSNSSSPSAQPPQAGSASEDHDKKAPSPGDVLSNAKVVFDAALSNLNKAESESGGNNTMDKAKVGAAAASVLAAAKYYGKMEDTNYGKYVQQAEDYLNNYGHNPQPTAGNSPVNNSTPPPPASQSSPATQEEGKEENKYSKYLQQAEGLLNKF